MGDGWRGRVVVGWKQVDMSWRVINESPELFSTFLMSAGPSTWCLDMLRHLSLLLFFVYCSFVCFPPAVLLPSFLPLFLPSFFPSVSVLYLGWGVAPPLFVLWLPFAPPLRRLFTVRWDGCTADLYANLISPAPKTRCPSPCTKMYCIITRRHCLIEVCSVPLFGEDTHRCLNEM